MRLREWDRNPSRSLFTYHVNREEKVMENLDEVNKVERKLLMLTEA
jgi:hypothetical protein